MKKNNIQAELALIDAADISELKLGVRQSNISLKWEIGYYAKKAIYHHSLKTSLICWLLSNTMVA